MRELLARLAWRAEECSTCQGRPESVASWSDPWGCWDCQNQGWTPVARWRWLSRRVPWTLAGLS